MRNSIHIVSLLLLLVVSGCTEPYALQAANFENYLVIEGTITNELKNQEIKVSRTLPIDVQLPDIVTNATVQVIDNSGTTYPFSLQDNSYKSDSPFQAEVGKQYKLIVSINGQSYESNLQAVPDESSIESVTANVITKNNGNRGVSIAVNSDNSAGNSRNYRYAYEETYIVKPPKWVNKDVIYDNITNDLLLVPRPINTQFGYASNNSAEIITTTTASLAQNKVENFEMRFIPNDNYIISYRYSILVKQFLLNQDAYTYFNNTQSLQSSSGSDLSPSQPGFIIGNIKNSSNPNEKIIGFFDVETVSEKRIFFNYADLFPNEELPPFFLDCFPREFDFTLVSDPTVRNLFIQHINNKQGVYFDGGGVLWKTVSPVCGDASYFYSLVKPSFWID